MLSFRIVLLSILVMISHTCQAVQKEENSTSEINLHEAEKGFKMKTKKFVTKATALPRKGIAKIKSFWKKNDVGEVLLSTTTVVAEVLSFVALVAQAVVLSR